MDEPALLLALTGLLDASHELAPADLPLAVGHAARALGAEDADVLLVDHSQRVFRSIGLADRREEVEGTVAGVAFCNERPEVVDRPDGRRELWLPLVDGTWRIGVVRFLVGDRKLDVAAFERLTVLIAELAVTKSRYSDIFEARRRDEELSFGAHMQWQLLPPLNYRTERFGVAGMLEPAYDMGGDSFDYADNGTHLDLEIFDAMGHGRDAVMMSAAVVASVRYGRSHGRPLAELYREADQLIEARFGDSRFVTAILASYEPRSGLLHWLPAGHLPPVLFRGHEMTELECAPSQPLGLGGEVHEIATAQLEPGDRVLFYTDGVVEGSRGAHHRFGLQGVKAVLDGSVAEGCTEAEIVRRLSSAVLRHNGGDLSDDATLMLLEVRSLQPDVAEDPSSR
jgi:serine phosphatase RsbU (regulator of sigma subunit)